MQRNELNFDFLKDEYVICICEGAAEEAIINLLIDNDLLVFTRSNLVGREITRKRKGSEIENSFLHRDYTKPVNIVRILDSKGEKFKLGKLYTELYPVYNIYTRPEIEMLLILAEGHYKRYLQKSKSNQKPSLYCQSEIFSRKHIKSKDFLQDYFQDTSLLISAIKQYNQVASKKNEANLYHLLNLCTLSAPFKN